MDARFYNSEEIDIQRLANDLVNAYLAQGYQAQQIGNNDQVLVQLKKGGDFEAIIGMQAALSVTLQRTSGGVLAMIGQQRWLDKAAVGAVGIVALPVLWPLALTAGVGAIRQASLGNQALNMVDGLVRQQRPGIVAGPIPYQLMPQIQQQWAPPPNPPVPTYVPPPQISISPAPPQALPAPVLDASPTPVSKGLRCSNCNTPYEPGDTFCSGCGRSLIAPKLYCSNCNSEVKQGASFCPKCGASTFHTLSSAAQPVQPRPAPVQPTPTVSYTPPPAAPATPVYTPPAKPPTPVYTPPATPVYTPPPTPPTPVYTPPSTPVYTPPPTPPTVDPHEVPTVSAPPTPPPYVPPVTQNPSSVPQPKVTYTPSAAKHEASVTPPPPRPQKIYYTPSNQAAQDQLTAATTQSAIPAQQPTQAQSIQQQPTVEATVQQPVADPGTTWGTLTFSNGTEVELKGERAVLGRYDHDLDGLQPDVDLSKFEGADTTSRIHAVIEHLGSGYTLTDLNSTNSTRLNGKRLAPEAVTPINDGDKLTFGKVVCTFKKA